MRITGYTYQADNYCVPCMEERLVRSGMNPLDIRTAEQTLNMMAEARGIDRDDEWTFDSDDFPKVILSTDDDGIECGQCGEEVGA